MRAALRLRTLATQMLLATDAVGFADQLAEVAVELRRVAQLEMVDMVSR